MLRNKLLAMQAELHTLENASTQATQTVKLDQASVGRLSRMDAMQSQQMAMASERRRQQLQLKIAGALRRMENGDYGDCFVCGEEIARARLQADPTHTRCVHCAELG